MDIIDKRILIELSGDIELEVNPYQMLANKLELDLREILNRIKVMQEKGYIKRIAPILYHQRTKYKYNALIAMVVDENDLDIIADDLMKNTKVSHVYHRKENPKWPYSLYGMSHGESENDIDLIIEEICHKHNIIEYKKIYTVREWKKTSPDLIYLLG